MDIDYTIYCAGLFDGEGCIYIGRGKDKRNYSPNYRLMVKVSMTDPSPIKKLVTTWGGHTCKSRNPNPNAKEVYNWCVYADRAISFLESILPWLDTKKERAEVAIRFQGEVKSSWQTKLHGPPADRKLSPRDIEIRDSFYYLMKSLNHRGIKEQG